MSCRCCGSNCGHAAGSSCTAVNELLRCCDTGLCLLFRRMYNPFSWRHGRFRSNFIPLYADKNGMLWNRYDKAAAKGVSLAGGGVGGGAASRRLGRYYRYYTLVSSVTLYWLPL